MKVLLVGISTRAMSQSAVVAGHNVTSLDFFGDRDQPGQARVIALGRDLGKPLTTRELARAATQLAGEADAVLVTSGLENDPGFFRILRKSALWLNNPPAAVKCTRDVHCLESAAHGTGACIPRTIFPGEAIPTSGRWLVKDLRHSGGQGVHAWDGKTPIKKSCILQEYLEGTLGSISFVADGRKAALLGMAYQYAGEEALAAPPFAWCGNAVPLVSPGLETTLMAYVQALVDRYGLVGINGLDFILSGGAPWILEVNPRPGGSIELYEHLGQFNAFELQINALQGQIPWGFTYPAGRAAARGILYARHELIIKDHPAWLSGRFGDLPRPGERIPAGSPVCSIFSQADSAKACWAEVVSSPNPTLHGLFEPEPPQGQPEKHKCIDS